jgi:hypothetical protein
MNPLRGKHTINSLFRGWQIQGKCDIALTASRAYSIKIPGSNPAKV